MRIGPFEGETGPGYDSTELADALADLPERIKTRGDIVEAGRHQLVSCPLPLHGGHVTCIVKRFAPQNWLKDRLDAGGRTKAHRSFVVACHMQEHAVGTPAPVAFLERWQGGRLAEAYFVTRFESNLVDLRKMLIRLYRFESQCAKVRSPGQRSAQRAHPGPAARTPRTALTQRRLRAHRRRRA